MARLRDVARVAGVSIATASHALSGAKRTTDAVRERVLAAAKALGYVPNSHARSLRTGRSGIFGVLVPDLTNPYFPALVKAVEGAARRLGFALIVMDAGEDERREAEGIEVLSTYRAEGVIWVPVADGSGVKPAFPTVTVDRPVAGCDSVVADHALGGALVARHVIDLGHKRVGLLVGPQSTRSAVLRLEGFLGAAGDDVDVVWIEEVPFQGELPRRAVRRVAALDCSVIICANDAVAVGVIRHAREAGIRIPSEISVVGFDDVPWAGFVEPALTTVRQPLKSLGARAVAVLHERIENSALETQLVTLPVELVVRQSVVSVAGRGG